MIYLAQPYSSLDTAVRDTRYLMGMAVCAYVANQRSAIYSPITHWHECAKHFQLPTDATFWQEDNERLLARSDEVWALCIPGWQFSKGMRHELRMAARLSRPVSAVHITELPYHGETHKIELPTLHIERVNAVDFSRLFAPDEIIEAYHGADNKERVSNGGSDPAPVEG